jgi:hypothetical protein
MTALLPGAQYAILVMAKLDRGSQYGEYGGGGSTGGGGMPLPVGGGYAGGLSRGRSLALAPCELVPRGLCLAALFPRERACARAHMTRRHWHRL